MISRPIFNLALKEVIHNKTWAAALLLLVLLPVFGVHLAPIAEDPAVLPSTRTQLAWVTAWLVSMFWTSWWAASLSSSQRQRNQRTWWKCFGVSDSRYFVSILSVPTILNVAVFGIATAISLVSGRPIGKDMSDWAPAVLQGFGSAVLAQTIVVALVTGLGNRFDSAASFAAGIALNVYGLYGLGFIDRLRTAGGMVSSISDMLWGITPHLHFGDFTSRLTFGWGSLPVNVAFALACYLLGWACLSFVVGRWLFRYRA